MAPGLLLGTAPGHCLGSRVSMRVWQHLPWAQTLAISSPTASLACVELYGDPLTMCSYVL